MLKSDIKPILLEIIEEIENNKIGSKQAPVQATMVEVQKLLGERIKVAINQLVIEKKITFGNTLNDIYFKTSKK